MEKHTPAPWKWVFLGNAGNYFLLGNNGEGPIVQGGPGFPDGNLMQAAPALLAVGEMVQKRLQESRGGVVSFTGEEWTQVDNAIAAAKGGSK